MPATTLFYKELISLNHRQGIEKTEAVLAHKLLERECCHDVHDEHTDALRWRK